MGKALIIDLQELASSSKGSTLDLLRKALIAAEKLRLDEFSDWIRKELKGYGDEDDVPEYRRLQGTIQFWNPYYGWRPVVFGDRKLEKAATEAFNTQPVGEIEGLLKTDPKGRLIQPLPSDFVTSFARDNAGLVPQKIIDRAQLEGVLEAVRNTVLEWALRLERDGVLGANMSFSDDEKHRAQASTAIHIQNFQGILGSVSSGQVAIGDYSSIHGQLKQAGISQEDRNELENLMDQFKKASQGKKKSLLAKGLDRVTRHASQLGTLSDALRAWFQGS
jgi:hypothetical protein